MSNISFEEELNSLSMDELVNHKSLRLDACESPWDIGYMILDATIPLTDVKLSFNVHDRTFSSPPTVRRLKPALLDKYKKEFAEMDVDKIKSYIRVLGEHDNNYDVYRKQRQMIALLEIVKEAQEN